MYLWVFTYKGCDCIKAKTSKQIEVRESVWIRLEESKGCGSWSDAIESILNLNETWRQEIIELRNWRKQHEKGNNSNISE